MEGTFTVSDPKILKRGWGRRQCTCISPVVFHCKCT